jgi:hypothetical protein
MMMMMMMMVKETSALVVEWHGMLSCTSRQVARIIGPENITIIIRLKCVVQFDKLDRALKAEHFLVDVRVPEPLNTRNRLAGRS